MHHESAPQPATPERHEEQEQARSPFDLERMEPRQVAGLIKALDIAYKSQDEDADSPDRGVFFDLSDQLDHDLISAADTTDKAVEIYGELAAGELADEGTRAFAVEMIPSLLRRYLDNPEIKQKIVELAVHILQSGGAGQELANYEVTQIVWNDLIDEPTSRYLDRYLYEGNRRWS